VELNITRFVTEAEPFEFSASRAERGQNAGPETWANALEEAAERPLLTTADELDAFRNHARGFGAWDDEEIAAWSPEECNALLIQMISGDLRELELCPGDGIGGIDWAEAERLSAKGTVSGRIGLWDDGSVGYYIGD
jgi:hypothetical protein